MDLFCTPFKCEPFNHLQCIDVLMVHIHYLFIYFQPIVFFVYHHLLKAWMYAKNLDCGFYKKNIPVSINQGTISPTCEISMDPSYALEKVKS